MSVAREPTVVAMVCGGNLKNSESTINTSYFKNLFTELNYHLWFWNNTKSKSGRTFGSPCTVPRLVVVRKETSLGSILANIPAALEAELTLDLYSVVGVRPSIV